MIFRPSGGLLYHLRALRAGARWRPFVEALEEWLASWKTGDELVLIGPSGGYTLPASFLARFKKITAYDLDPLASVMFRRQHPNVSVEFRREDAFWQDAILSTLPIRTILDRHPDAAILFSNVLGQLLLEGKAAEPDWLAFLEQLRSALHGRNWASYHDVFTHEGGEVIDHLLAGPWKEGLPSADFEWQLTPKSLHRIQGVRER